VTQGVPGAFTSKWVGLGGRRILFYVLILLLLAAGGISWGHFDLPPLPPPHEFGDVLINRVSTEKGQRPVGFSHWSHRVLYTCRVCHFELDFEMKANTTEITERANRNGRFCGACHDGETAFGYSEENCVKCHNGGELDNRKQFKKKLNKLPKSKYGNRIDWSKALSKGLINPRQSILEDDYKPLPFKQSLDLEAEWAMIPPAVFVHDEHSRWLDCANCHPDIFNIKKKTTEHFEMIYILKGAFCGACHIKVAFPLDDCKRCHPTMRD